MAASFPAPEKLATYEHPGFLYSVTHDPARPVLYAGSFDYGVYVYDLGVEKKEPTARWTGHDNYVSTVAAFTQADRGTLISGSFDRKLLWWNTGTGKTTHSVDAHNGWIRSIAAFPDGERIVSVGDDMLVKVWEAATGKLLHSLVGHHQKTPQDHPNALYTVAISADGKTMVTGDRMGDVRVWDADSGRLEAKFEVPTLYTYDPRQRKRSIGGIRTLTFSADGRYVAAGGIGQVNNVDGLAGPTHVEIWDWRKPKLEHATGAADHKGIVQHLIYHPSGPWLIGGGGGQDDGFIAFWDLRAIETANRDEKAKLPTHIVKTGGHVQSMSLNADGSELYAAGYNKLEVWKLGRYRRF